MPEDPTVQIILIVAVVLIIGLALWLGRGLIFRKGEDGITFEAKQKPGQTKVSVAEGLQAEKAEIGNVTGVEREGGTDTPQDQDIDVLKKATITESKFGDITGLKQSGKSSGES